MVIILKMKFIIVYDIFVFVVERSVLKGCTPLYVLTITACFRDVCCRFDICKSVLTFTVLTNYNVKKC